MSKLKLFSGPNNLRFLILQGKHFSQPHLPALSGWILRIHRHYATKNAQPMHNIARCRIYSAQCRICTRERTTQLSSTPKNSKKLQIRISQLSFNQKKTVQQKPSSLTSLLGFAKGPQGRATPVGVMISFADKRPGHKEAFLL